MDSITQAVLGGVVGELVLGRKIGGKGMAWGLLFGTMPDLDIVFSPWLDQIERLRWHRGISHSLVMMVAAAFLFAKPLAWIHRKRGLTAKRAGWFVFWAWSTHVLIDVFTTYGTQIFEPFSDQRVALSNLFIIDLFFTLPMLIWVLYRAGQALWRLLKPSHDEEEDEESEEFSTKGAAMALMLSGLYVCFSLVMKVWATHQIEGQMAEAVPQGELVAVTPTAFNTILWRGLIETEQGYFVTYWSPLDEKPSTFHFFAKQHELAEPFEGSRTLEGLRWFARDHWVARKDSEDGSMVFVDMRFGELRDYEKGQMAPMFRWQLSLGENGDIELGRKGRSVDAKRTLLGIWRRLWGDQDAWEAMKSF